MHPPLAARKAKLDNLALLPGSLLPFIRSCQEIANRLPDGGVLIVLPAGNPIQKQALLAVARLLAQEGHQVSVIPADDVPHRMAVSQGRRPID